MTPTRGVVGLDPPEIDESGLIRDTDEIPYWIPGAFPTIFQNETGDPHNYRLKKPDLFTWGPHIMRSKGWVAQAHTSFLYWWTNMCNRVKVAGAKKWYIKDNPQAQGYTADDISRMGVGLLAKKVSGYTQVIPGTRASKANLRASILAMVRQLEIETRGAASRQHGHLGDVPCLFGTLTSQRYYWDQIIQMICEMEGISGHRSLSRSRRMELVNKYPLFVAWYCAMRLELTLKNVVVPVFGASNYFAVFEWSPTGGMVHLHYILWKAGAPRFDLRAEQLLHNAKSLRKAGMVGAAMVQKVNLDDIFDFFSAYVSEWNPNKDDEGKDKVDAAAERVNKSNVDHTAALSVEEMLELLSEDQTARREDVYMKMVRLEQSHDYHHPDPLGPPNPTQPCARLLKGTSNMWYCSSGYPKDLVCQPCEQSVAQDPLRPDLWRCNLSRNCPVMNTHIPCVSFANQSNTDAQPIATKEQAELYCAKYCTKHHKTSGARSALYDVMDIMKGKDDVAQGKHGDDAETSKIGPYLHKMFNAEIGEEMVQTEVAHHANNTPEFFANRRFKKVHIYRKLLALDTSAKIARPMQKKGAEELNQSSDWQPQYGKRFTPPSDLELYEKRTKLWFEEGVEPLQYLPWKESAEEQVAALSLYDFFRYVRYHGGWQAYLSWHDPTGKEPWRMPVVIMQPHIKLKENGDFSKNALFALLQYNAWTNRNAKWLTIDEGGDAAYPEEVKDYFREWALSETSTCPWYIREQYLRDNHRPVRTVQEKANLKSAPRSNADSKLEKLHEALQECRDNDERFHENDLLERIAHLEAESATAAADQDHEKDIVWDASDTEESDLDESGAQNLAETKILRQLRGSSQAEEVDRWPAVCKKTSQIKGNFTYYKHTKLTSRAQEDQSALPAGVVNVYEDSSDEEAFFGEQLEIEKEMQALSGARQWINQEGWDAEGEGKATDKQGNVVDLRLDWEVVKRQLDKGSANVNDEGKAHGIMQRDDVLRDYSLTKLDPTQRVFADLVLSWGENLCEAYKHNLSVKDPRKLKRPPLLRTYLGGSAGSGKSTTLKVIVQHLRLKFQESSLDARVELVAYTGVAAFNISLGATTACKAFNIFPKAAFTKELRGDQYRQLEKQWHNVVLLVVDEISFIGRAFFYRMHCRTQQAMRGKFAERGVDPDLFQFGDLSMILVGDFGQLEPIDDISFCDDEMTYRTCPKNLWNIWGHAQHGRRLMETFREAIMLKRIHRSKDDLWWTESCLRLRDFEMTYEEDYQSWRQHDLDRGHLSADQKRHFEDHAVWLCARCQDVGARNGRKLAFKAQDEKKLIHQVHAQHSQHKAAKRQPSSAFDGLRPVINLVRGCKIMITRNIAYKYGLANGTRGTLVGIVYARGASVGSFPDAMIVEVADYCGPPFYEQSPTWVPILPKLSRKEGTRQTREQFPLVAGYAFTVNKSQGLTIKEGVVIHLAGGKRFKPAAKHGLPFVAFTRSESFAMTAFKNLPAWDDFAKGYDTDMLRMRKRFTEMLEKKHTATMHKYSIMQNEQDEDDQYRVWREQQESNEMQKPASDSSCKSICPACQANFPLGAD